MGQDSEWIFLMIGKCECPVMLTYSSCIRSPTATRFCRVRYDHCVHSTINTLTGWLASSIL